MSDSMPVKMTSKRDASRVSASSTGRSKMALSASAPAYQRSAPVAGSRNASPYFCPAERREAASAAILNQGCCCKARINCWPTMPVAPTMAAFNIDVVSSFAVGCEREVKSLLTFYQKDACVAVEALQQ